MEDLPEEKMASIHPNHLEQNPIRLMISIIGLCSIVSNALAKSCFSTTIGVPEALHWCRNSNAQPRQSWIDLPFKNPYWLECTKPKMNTCNRSSRSLVIMFRQ